MKFRMELVFRKVPLPVYSIIVVIGLLPINVMSDWPKNEYGALEIV